MGQDQNLTCKDCSNEFVFTSGEQDFYAQKGFSSPTRCKNCRDLAKQKRRTDRQEYEIICKECGQKGTVPFQPRDPSSVLCSDCFAKSRGLTPVDKSQDQPATDKSTDEQVAE